MQLPLKRALVAWLAFSLVALQSLAFMHRIVHGPQVQLGTPAPSWIADLFAGHDDDSKCKLADAIGHDAVASPGVVVLPLALPAFVLAALQGGCLLRFAALFEARAPPSFR